MDDTICNHPDFWLALSTSDGGTVTFSGTVRGMDGVRDKFVREGLVSGMDIVGKSFELVLNTGCTIGCGCGGGGGAADEVDNNVDDDDDADGVDTL